MKRLATSLLVTMLLLPGIPARAQTTLAISGGMNVASMDFAGETEFVPDFQSVNRASIGLAVTFPVFARLGLRLGGNYSQKGGLAEVSMGGLTGESFLDSDYLELTALARVRVPTAGDRVAVNLLAGPALALETSCELGATAVDRTGSTSEYNETCDDADFDRLRHDLGLAAGGELEIGLAEKLGLSIGVLYTHGVLDIDTVDDASLKHRALTLRAGLVYSFR